ncbi:PREDICTED: uncharacterized protein LOC106907987 [Poecilia mexicana]|uniref:uncharacterized protein LOC106907987 n=1 Tax=Poecilia mexicana TaxID=48701 RepID=UPI00072DB6FC|nr:PREDICTED: uncharacterized protein LOC106907987 [Poecilia mexicana]
MAPPNTPSYCPICQYKYLYLGKHLENKHLIKNKAERRILINYGRGRVNIRGMSCPIEECKYSRSRVDSHLKQGHPELDAAKIRDIIQDIKNCCVVDQLKALRANNPQPPMMSSLDLDSEDHEEMLVDVATTDSPCTSSSCKLVLENKKLKAELKSLRRKYKSQVRWAKKARKKIMTLEQASSSAPPEQELFQEEHSEPELHRVGLELQRQSSDLQQPSVSNEEEAPVIQQVWSLASRSSQNQKEAEHQWTEEEQMEPEPKWIKREEEEPEPALFKHEEIEYPLMYVRKEELDSLVLQHEQQPPEHLPTGQDQKNLCSSQEGEQLVQKQFVALIETSTLQEDMSEEETRTEQLSLHVSAVNESKDQEGSSCSVSESQSDTGTKKRPFKCDICGKCYTQRWKLKNHYRTHTDLQQPSVSNEEEDFAIQQVWSLASRSSQDQKEREHQWTEEEQMEPEPNWIKKEKEEPEPTLFKHEEIEYPLMYVRKEELDSSVLQHEQQPPEHLPTGQDQKDLCSSQEGEQLVQKQFVALIETSTLQGDDMSEEETRTEQLSLHISPVVESKDQEGSSCSVSESQSDTGTKKKPFKCDICGRRYTQKRKLKKHYRIHTGHIHGPQFCFVAGPHKRQMSSLDNTIKDIMIKTLPNLCEDTQKKLVSTLVISGVQSAEDLKYIQQEDIKNLLPVVQQRKLLESFKQETNTDILDMEFSSPSPALPFSSPPCSSTSSLSSIPPISEQPSALKTPLMLCQNEQQNVSWSWPEDFQVSWNKMPLEIQTAIAKGKRPPPDKRRQMIRILADEMQKYEANPTRSQCLTVCQKITRQYPDSFADMTPSGKLIAGGYSSLLSQLKTRIENINRCGTFRSYRSSGPCGIAGVKRGPTDMYGCTRFQPELPPEETDDTVEEKRQRLQSTFNKYGINGDDRPEVTDLMETTYSLQRQHINRIPAPSITDLQINWPFLFTQRGIFSHFELLTDVPLLHVLELSIEECGNAVVEYFRTKVKASSVQTILAQKATGDLAFLVIQLLMAHFNESPDSLMLTTDKYTTAADVNTSLSLPASPRLILCGNEQALAGWMVSIEGHVVFEGVQPTFLTGLAAVFATFYIFNLQYQDEAAKTLEFIQRRFIGINPERGTKTGNGRMVSKKTGKIIQKKKQTVNTQVSTLIKNLMDFECHLIQ